ncbi:nitrogen fixation protein NifQ [Ketobacter sp.]|uniref:nitrogen fixation protein NifQ n=1 Tax=Ketobacter sp. TaxID=2083498 RepID=UPI0025B9F813|nr:nitrogen fixation protein NifQ [Ketobacter sp.]
MNAQAKWVVNAAQSLSVKDMPEPGACPIGQLQQARLLSQLVYSQRQGKGCLPYCLGLMPLDFVWLLHQYLADSPLLERLIDPTHPANVLALEKGAMRQDLMQLRQDEWMEVRDLLLSARAGDSEFEVPLAGILAAGCLGGDHLWRDLGLKSRTELSELMACHFPELAQRNSGDMKWKKFFYKQLCEQDGGYVCRAPSCEQCAAYDDCFGPEE